MLHRGTYMPESEFEAMTDADDEEHTAVAKETPFGALLPGT